MHSLASTPSRTLLPVLGFGDLPGPLAQFTFGRTDQVAPPGLLQPSDVLGAGHPAIHHPDALGHSVARLHRSHDLFHGGHVGAIAGEHFVAQRHPLAGDHQGDADLFAVGPMIAAVAALGQRVALGQAFEVGAGHIVEQQVVLQREQLAQPAAQMLLEGLLVRQQPIQGAVETIVVDPLHWQPQQILQRGRAIPVLGDVQFAGRFGQAARLPTPPPSGPTRPPRGPRGISSAHSSSSLQRAPQASIPATPRRTTARTFDAHSIEPHRDALLIARRRGFKQFALFAASA